MTLEPQAPQRCAALLLRRLRALQEAAEAWDPASAVVKVLAVANAEAGGGTAQVRSVQQAARNLLREAFDEFSQDLFFEYGIWNSYRYRPAPPPNETKQKPEGRGRTRIYMIFVFRYLGMSKCNNIPLEGSFSVVSKTIFASRIVWF